MHIKLKKKKMFGKHALRTLWSEVLEFRVGISHFPAVALVLGKIMVASGYTGAYSLLRSVVTSLINPCFAFVLQETKLKPGV